MQSQADWLREIIARHQQKIADRIQNRTLTGYERVCRAVKANPTITVRSLTYKLRSRCLAPSTVRQYHWAARKAIATQ